MQCSRDSLTDFLNLFLGIDANHRGFHQWLTFGRDVPEPESKRLLSRFFTKLGRRKPYRDLPFGAIYVQQRQPQTNHIHYHVRFMFFGGRIPNSMVKAFRAEAYSIWNGLNGGNLNRSGNGMRERPHRHHYFLLDVSVLKSTDTQPRGETNWWGCWNKKVLREHYSKPSPESVALIVKEHTPNEKPRVEHRYYSMAWLRREKANVEWENDMDWEGHKCFVTRHNGKVTDAQFLEFKNGLNPWKRKKPVTKKAMNVADDVDFEDL